MRTVRPARAVLTDVWDASDEALIAGLATGDPDIARVFVQRFQSRVYGLALAITRDRAAAEEVAQDAYVRAWRYAASYDPRRGSVSTWLLRITRNVALDHVRARERRRDRVVADPADTLAELAGEMDVVSPLGDLDVVAEGLRSLPDDRARHAHGVRLLRADHPGDQRSVGRPARDGQDPASSGAGQAARQVRGGVAMRPMDCADLAEIAPELALEVIGGRQRAAALAHLETCVACQQHVDALAADVDRLLLLAPQVEPPDGFDERVVRSLTRAHAALAFRTSEARAALPPSLWRPVSRSLPSC